MWYFGKTKNGEYGFDVFKERFETYIEMTEEEHDKLTEQARNNNKWIVADKDGKPVLEDPPTPSEKEQKLLQIEDLLGYLQITDWYVIRQLDEGTPMPEDIKKKRAEAREEISRLRSEMKS